MRGRAAGLVAGAQSPSRRRCGALLRLLVCAWLAGGAAQTETAAGSTLIPRASSVQVAGPVDEAIAIELRASLQIPDGGVAQLPVIAAPARVAVDGDGAPRDARVWSASADGVYNAGQDLSISVEFTSAVEIIGDASALKLVLNTGCDDDACATFEEQTVTCKADSGKFALTLYDGGSARNIDAHIDQEGLKSALETIDGVENVTVYYDDADDRDYSGGAACTSVGNEITITFERCSYADAFDGDVPELQFDVTNAVLDGRTFLEVGDGTARYGSGRGAALAASSTLIIDVVAPSVINVDTPAVDGEYGVGAVLEIHVTFDRPVSVGGTPTLVMETGDVDRSALFTTTTDSNYVMIFEYTVTAGDASQDLDYRDGESGNALRVSGDAYVKRYSSDVSLSADANITMPYAKGDGSLAANADIIIDTSVPYVLSVSLVGGGYSTTARAGDDVDLLRFPAIVEAPVGADGVVPAPARAYSAVAVDVAFALTSAFAAGDNVTVGLPYFRGPSAGNCSSLERTTNWVASFKGVGAEAALVLTATRSVAGGEPQAFTVPSKCSVLAPKEGLHAGTASGATVAAKTALGAYPETALSDVAGVAVAAAALSYDPAVAGEETVVTLDFELLATLAVNETLDWTLGALTVPNYTLPTDFFRKNSSVNASAGLDPYYERNVRNWTAVPVVVDDASFHATWNQKTKVLSLRALETLEAGARTVAVARDYRPGVDRLLLDRRGLRENDARLHLGSDAGALGYLRECKVYSPAVGAFGDTRLEILAPDGFGPATASSECLLRLTFALGLGSIKSGEVVEVYLPSFRELQSYDATQPEAFVEVLSGGSFSATWGGTNSRYLALTATADGAAGEGVELTLEIANMVTPSAGVSPIDGGGITIQSFAAAAPTDALPLLEISSVGSISSPELECLPAPCSLAAASELTLTMTLGGQGRVRANDTFSLALPYHRHKNATKNNTLYERWGETYDDLAARKIPLAVSTIAGAHTNVTARFSHSNTKNARVDFTFQQDLPASGGAFLATIPRSAGLVLPSRGVYTEDADVILRSTNGRDFRFGDETVTHYCGGLCSAGYAWPAGAVGNDSSYFTFEFYAEAGLAAGDAFEIRLPGFTRTDRDWEYSGGISGVVSEHLTWDPATELLRFVFADSLAGAASTKRTLVVGAAGGGANFIFPEAGIAATHPNFTVSHNISAVMGRRGGWSTPRLVEYLPALDPLPAKTRAGKESEIPNFKGSYLGRFPPVSADFWTSDHLLERPRSVDAFWNARARNTHVEANLNLSFPAQAKTRIRAAYANFSNAPSYDAVTLTVRLSRAVGVGEALTFTFAGGFSGSPAVGGGEATGGGNAAFALTSWDDATETLVVAATAKIPAETTFFVNVTGLAPPSAGVAKGSAQGLSLSTDEGFGALAIAAVRVDRPVVFASSAALTVYADELGVSPQRRRSPGVPHGRAVLDVAATLAGVAIDEDVFLDVVLPGFSIADATRDAYALAVNASRYGPRAGTTKTITANATWYPQTSTMRLSFNGTVFADGRVKVRVGDLAFERWNDTLRLPPLGLRDGDDANASATFLSRTAKWDDAATALAFPCAGVCSKSVTFAAPKAGYSRLRHGRGRGGDCFRRLGRQDAPLRLGGADGNSFVGTWNRNTSTITLTTKLGDAYKFEDSRRTYELQVQYSSYIALPQYGVRKEDATIGVGFNGSTVGSLAFDAADHNGVGYFPSQTDWPHVYGLPRVSYSDRVAGARTTVSVLLTYDSGAPRGRRRRRVAARTALAPDDDSVRVSVDGARSSASSAAARSSSPVGAIADVELRWDPVVLRDPGGLNLSFTTSCELTRGDTVQLRLPGFSSRGGHLPVYGLRRAGEPNRPNGSDFSRVHDRFNASWDPSGVITFTVTNATEGTSHGLRVGRNASLDRDTVAYDFQNYPLKVNSSRCPTGWVPYAGPSVGLRRAGLDTFANDGDPARAGRAAEVTFAFLADGDLEPGDKVTFALPGFENHTDTVSTGVPGVFANWSAPLLDLVLESSVAAGAPTVVPVVGLRLPDLGIDPNNHHITVSMVSRASGTLGPTLAESVPSVPGVSEAALSFSSALAGRAATATFALNATVGLPAGAVVEVAGLDDYVVDASSLVSAQSSSLTVVAGVAAFTLSEDVEEKFTASFNVTLPAAGVDSAHNDLAVSASAVGLDGVPLTAVTDVVGFSTPPSLSFGSNDFGYVRIGPGDPLKIRFPPSADGDADGLTNTDAGMQYKVGGALMTVAAVDGDVISLAAPQGFNETQRVVARKFDEYGNSRSDGLVNVETPGFRPAWYYSGSGTTTLIFRYVVKPGDAAADLEYRSISSLACPGPAQALALGQGDCYIRRTSPTPTADANLELRELGTYGSLGYTADVVVDTRPPRVANVTTTAALACGYPAFFPAPPDDLGRGGPCVYGKGSDIDVVVMSFDAPVMVDEDAVINLVNASNMSTGVDYGAAYVQAPRWAAAAVKLDVATTDGQARRRAFYKRGSGTQDLVFVYEVEDGDLSLNALDYVAPTDVNYTSLPLPGTALSLAGSSATRVVVDAAAPVITRVSALEDGVYAPGDRVDFAVTWDEPVVFGDNCSDTALSLWLDVDNPRLERVLDPVRLENGKEKVPFRAYPLGNNGSAPTRTLTFRYVVRSNDTAPRLDTLCAPCGGTLKQPALWVNASCRILGAESGRPASVLLPAANAPGSLARTSDVEITSAPPAVLSVTADVVDILTSPKAPGDVLRIFVEFDSAVVVGGDPAFSSTRGRLDEAPTLELALGDGARSVFAEANYDFLGANATYAAGSGTKKLRFEVVVRAPMGSVRVDYRARSSLRGLVLRLSDDPTLPADLTLPARGSPRSLGGFGVELYALSVDTAEPLVSGARATATRAVASARKQTLDVEILARSATFRGAVPSITNGSIALTLGAPALATTDCLDASSLNATGIASALRRAYGAAAPFVSEQPLEGRGYVRRFASNASRIADVAFEFDTLVVLADGSTQKSSSMSQYEGTTACARVVAADAASFVGGGRRGRGRLRGSPLESRGGVVAAVHDGNGTGTGIATLARSSHRTQLVDVGVSASRHLAGGEFQLVYGDDRTACIQYDAGYDGIRSIRARLDALPAVAAAGGVRAVTREDRGRGFRIAVALGGGAEFAPLPIRPAAPRAGECRALDPPDATVEIGAASSLALRAEAERGSRLVFTVMNGTLPGNASLEFTVPDLILPKTGVGVGGAGFDEPLLYSKRSPFAPVDDAYAANRTRAARRTSRPTRARRRGCGPCAGNSSTRTLKRVFATSRADGSLAINVTVNGTLGRDAYASFDLHASNNLTLPKTATYAYDDRGPSPGVEGMTELRRANASAAAATIELASTSLEDVAAAATPVAFVKATGLAWAQITFNAREGDYPDLGNWAVEGARAGRRARVDYRPSTDIDGEIKFALPGVLDPRPRAYEGESNSFDHADVPLTGRDARYFFARFGGLSEASHAHTDADAADKANATLNGTLTLFAVAPLRPRPQGYEVSLDTLVAPVRGIVDHGAPGADAPRRRRRARSVRNDRPFVGVGAFVGRPAVDYVRTRGREYRRTATAPPPGAETTVELNFTYSAALAPGDVLDLTLPGFSMLNGSAGAVDIETVYAGGAVLTLNDTDFANDTLSFWVVNGSAAFARTGVAVSGLAMPQSSLRYDESSIALSCRACRYARAAATSALTPGFGVAFAAARLAGDRDFTVPAEAGRAAYVRFDVAISEPALAGDTVDFGGLAGPSADVAALALVDSGGYASASWDAGTGLVRLKLATRVVGGDTISVTVDASEGLGAPATGLGIRRYADPAWSDPRPDLIQWIAKPVTLEAAKFSQLGYFDEAHKAYPYADTTPVGAVMNGTLDFGVSATAGANDDDVSVNLKLAAPRKGRRVIDARTGALRVVLEVEDGVPALHDIELTFPKHEALLAPPAEGVPRAFDGGARGSGARLGATVAVRSAYGHVPATVLAVARPVCAVLDGSLVLASGTTRTGNPSRAGDLGTATLAVTLNSNASKNSVVEFVLPYYSHLKYRSYANVTGMPHAQVYLATLRNDTNETALVVTAELAAPAASIEIVVHHARFPSVTLYADDPDVAVSVTDVNGGGCGLDDLVPLPSSDAVGFKFADLHFPGGSAAAGEPSAFTLTFGFDEVFYSSLGYGINLDLPGFTKLTNGSRNYLIADVLPGGSRPVEVNASWDPDASRLSVRDFSGEVARGRPMTLTVPRSFGLRPPRGGLNGEGGASVSAYFGASSTALGGRVLPTPVRALSPEIPRVLDASLALFDARSTASAFTVRFNTSLTSAAEGALDVGARVMVNLPDWIPQGIYAQDLAKSSAVAVPLQGRDGANFTGELRGTAALLLEARDRLNKNAFEIVVPRGVVAAPKRGATADAANIELYVKPLGAAGHLWSSRKSD
ncbi:hypothetical protein JL720_8347 [Aureococcus anophagefferens]|nr:hypothetical protein JL720_8347 [Aureococcus anophagefferens]